MMFKLVKFFSPLLILCTILTIGCVFAVWYYTYEYVQPENDTFALAFSEFIYAPEEVVPGGSEQAPVGENHLLLIEMILNEASYGLNATKKPILHNLLEAPGDVVYCTQNVQGGNLKHLLVDASVHTERLYFVITKISDTEYHTFTFAAYELDKPVGTEIIAYKTVMKKGSNGIWTAPQSYKGMVETNAPSIVSRGIDVTSWYET